MSADPAQIISNQISRFKVHRRLGQGAEGTVYLASDPELERPVAIKTLTLKNALDPALAEQLLSAAKTVSTLSHPNIVPVFEVGMHDGQPFVVFEYVEGKTLADLITSDGALPLARAVILMSQILGGVAHVHASGVLHGDLKPANILIGANGIPRVTDFGISRRAHTALTEAVSMGTVRYMAPECFADGRADYRFDVFALGLIFHEMLTGEPVISGDNEYAQIYRIVNEAPQAPSLKNPRVPAPIDAIVLKALDKDPVRRYADAAEMKRELDRFRVPAANDERMELKEQSVHATVEFLLRRMSIKSDFPALSASFTRINQLSAMADDGSLKTLSELIMRDFALTQKLLRVVNSAAVGAGKITKVSQAVTVLGIAQLRSLATGMMLSSGGNAGQKDPRISAALTDAFICAVIARNIGRMAGLAAAVEELFICGMFGCLGQLLTLFYLGDEYTEISRRIDQEQVTSTSASRAVLGLSFDQLGAAVAQHWHFPENIVAAMAPLPADTLAAPRTADERMWHCAGYAKELCESLGLASADKRAATLAAHLTRFSPSIPVNSETVIALIGHSVDVAMKYVTASGLGQPKTALLDAFAALRAAGEVASPAPAPAPAPEKTQPVTTAAEPAPVPADTPAQALPTESKVTPERPAAPGFASKLVRAWRSLF